MSHFEDKTEICVMCTKKVKIKHNQIGGGWHLTALRTPDGALHYGFHCSQCFDRIKAKLLRAQGAKGL